MQAEAQKTAIDPLPHSERRGKMKRKLLALLLILTMVFTMGNHTTTTHSKAAEKTQNKTEQGILGSADGFRLSDGQSTATVYIDTAHEEISADSAKKASADGDNEYCGLKLIADTFAGDVGLVTDAPAKVITNAAELSENVIIAGTIGHNDVIDALIANGKIDVSGLYKNGELKWDCYQMQFISGDVLASCGYPGADQALVITGSNKRGAMYGMFHISEHIGVSVWVYMADAVPAKHSAVYLDPSLLAFNQENLYLAKEPSVKYRGFFINDESPSFTGWAYKAFGGLNEDCYQHVFELLIRMKANYLWPAMWGNSFSDEGKSRDFRLANAVLADAYGVCMGTSHHEACHRAGIEWQKKFRTYGKSNAWDYTKNADAIYQFWKGGIERNGNFETTITMGMRGEADSALKGGVQENIDLLKQIISDQNQIIDQYVAENPDSKTKDAPKIYIPYSENEEYFYGPDDGSIDGLNKWNGLDDVTIMLTDDNYGNLRSIPEESKRNRAAGWGLYYHLDGHVGTGAYEWVSSTQLEHIWDQLTMAYDYNIRDIWVVNVGDIKPVEMELNYAMDLAYDMERWGQSNTAETYRSKWLQNQLGGRENCPDEVAEGVAECVADFLKISTYRKAEYVKSTLYSNTNYNEAQEVLDLCERTIAKTKSYYETYFKGTDWDDAYYQIVYYQAVATANVTRMMIFKSMNDFYGEQNSSLANVYAALVDQCVALDQELTDYYNNEMSDGKWSKMMSSPHVGFVTWNSDGWSYPKGTEIQLPTESKMLVSPDGDPNAHESGTVSLPVFTNTGKERYCITMSNGGTSDYTFTAGTLADWIQITDKEGKQIVNGGTVSDAAYFYLSVDWSKVRSNKTGTVVIKGNGQTVKLNVTTSYTEYKEKGIGTHFESQDVVTIEGEEYITAKPSANGVSWGRIDGYGRYQSAMKMFPTTESFTTRTGETTEVKTGNQTRIVTAYEAPTDAPYMEYRVYVDEDSDYTFTAYTTTTNNIFKPSDWGYVPVELFYGIQVDDNPIQNINSLPDGKYISYAADGDNRWKDGIMNNIHVSASKEYMSAGIHTVRIYGMHAGLGLERLVISNQPLKESYLGPQKTFMLDYDVIPQQKMGVHFEAAAGTLQYGAPSDPSSITDPDDKNDPSDPVMEETPIPRPEPTPDATGGIDPAQNTPAQTRPSQTVSPAEPANQTPAPSKAKVVKGKTYLSKGLRYKVISLTKKGGTVSVSGTSKKNLKRAVVPAAVNIKGGTFKVTEIGKNSFRACRKLTNLTIGSNIKKIGAGAFRGCTKLKQVTIRSKQLVSVGKQAFSGIARSVSMKLPAKKRKKYKSMLQIG